MPAGQTIVRGHLAFSKKMCPPLVGFKTFAVLDKNVKNMQK